MPNSVVDGIKRVFQCFAIKMSVAVNKFIRQNHLLDWKTCKRKTSGQKGRVIPNILLAAVTRNSVLNFILNTNKNETPTPALKT